MYHVSIIYISRSDASGVTSRSDKGLESYKSKENQVKKKNLKVETNRKAKQLRRQSTNHPPLLSTDFVQSRSDPNLAGPHTSVSEPLLGFQ